MSDTERDMVGGEEQQGRKLTPKEQELQQDTAEYLRRIQAAHSNPDEEAKLAKELALEKQQLESLSERDALTGLLNRRGFIIEVNRTLRRLRRNLEQTKAQNVSLGSILFIDADNFEEANKDEARDKHDFGDKVLKELAIMIGKSLRPDDIVYRYGGDEVVVLLADCNLGNATGVAERIRTTVDQQSSSKLDGYHQTVSIGIAQMPENISFDTIDSIDFLNEKDEKVGIIESTRQEADRALFYTKASGKNRVAFSSLTGQLAVLEKNPDTNGNIARYEKPGK